MYSATDMHNWNLSLIGCSHATLVKSRDLGLASICQPTSLVMINMNFAMQSGNNKLGKGTELGLGLGFRLVFHVAYIIKRCVKCGVGLLPILCCFP